MWISNQVYFSVEMGTGYRLDKFQFVDVAERSGASDPFGRSACTKEYEEDRSG